MKNIVILISGGGSNMAAIVNTAKRDNWAGRFGARVAGVISNKPEAKGLLFAAEQGIPTAVVSHKSFASREEFDDALAKVIDRYEQPDAPVLLVLAGFMRILTPGFVSRYAGRFLNIHPSLLPAFPGCTRTSARWTRAARSLGSRCIRSPRTDHGPILAQAVVPVLPGDTADALAARVLTQEHLIYPRAIADLLQNE
ncbi:MAG: phosphoribosylglycinamide formyltransferase [Rhodoferax sp.]|nr:phosphoribosylglycinamide formyltransferase [Rhodoferax sp.]